MTVVNEDTAESVGDTPSLRRAPHSQVHVGLGPQGENPPWKLTPLA